eukprot:jgi/Bigna1/75502/fgenesh1_pg.35_\
MSNTRNLGALDVSQGGNGGSGEHVDLPSSPDFIEVRLQDDSPKQDHRREDISMFIKNLDTGEMADVEQRHTTIADYEDNDDDEDVDNGDANVNKSVSSLQSSQSVATRRERKAGNVPSLVSTRSWGAPKNHRSPYPITATSSRYGGSKTRAPSSSSPGKGQRDVRTDNGAFIERAESDDPIEFVIRNLDTGDEVSAHKIFSELEASTPSYMMRGRGEDFMVKNLDSGEEVPISQTVLSSPLSPQGALLAPQSFSPALKDTAGMKGGGVLVVKNLDEEGEDLTLFNLE